MPRPLLVTLFPTNTNFVAMLLTLVLGLVAAPVDDRLGPDPLSPYPNVAKSTPAELRSIAAKPAQVRVGPIRIETEGAVAKASPHIDAPTPAPVSVPAPAFAMVPAPVPAPASAPGAGRGRFTILQLNDVYRVEGLENGALGGLARVRTVRRELEAQGRPVLVLHGGDLFYPSVMSKYLKAEPMVQGLNLLDGDPNAFDPSLIVVFGNHEFDASRDVFLARMAQCDFRWVSSNVYYKAPGASTLPMHRKFANVHDTLLVVEDDVAVGILGLTHDTQKTDYVGYTFDRAERRTLVSQALRDLKSRGARVLVALTHQDMTEDVWLAREFPELDLIVGGQEHFYQVRKVGPTWITKADSDAKTVIVIDVQAPATGRASVSPTRKELRDPMARDGVLDDHARRSLDQLKQAYEVVAKAKGKAHFDLDETLATTENLLEGDEGAVRGRETALGNFLTDVIREHMRTNIAFISGGGLRLNDNIPAGSAITNYHMEGVFFYDDPLVTFSITRDQLLDVLKNAVSKVHLGDGRFLQVSGLKFKYHKKGDPDDPSYEIRPDEVEVLIDSPPGPPRYCTLASADGKGPFTVATVEFLWARGSEDGYTLFSAKNKERPVRTDNPASPVSFRKTTEAHLADLTKAGKRVAAKKEGRIVEVSP